MALLKPHNISNRQIPMQQGDLVRYKARDGNVCIISTYVCGTFNVVDINTGVLMTGIPSCLLFTLGKGESYLIEQER